MVLLSGRGVGSPGRDFAVYESSVELEHAVKESGADWTIVQPAWFAQGFSEDFLRDHVLAGEIRLSAGDGAEAWIDTNDVGDVMTAALLDEKHTGEILRAVRSAHADHDRGRRRTVDRDRPPDHVRRPRAGASTSPNWSSTA